MIIYELTQTENNPVYQDLQVSNGKRHYDFLSSIVTAALGMGRPFLSQEVIRALNYHAIACLHVNAGMYRPCEVHVNNHNPPEHYRVQALMDDFVNHVNLVWKDTDEVVLASYVLWRINWIHPFINGNGRTARAAAYFVLCCKAGGLLQGTTILPQLLHDNRPEYVQALSEVDASFAANDQNFIAPLHAVVARLLQEQLNSA